MPAATPPIDAVSVPRVLAGLAIDYFRWMQLIPMVSADSLAVAHGLDMLRRRMVDPG